MIFLMEVMAKSRQVTCHLPDVSDDSLCESLDSADVADAEAYEELLRQEAQTLSSISLITPARAC
jgi:hypothetical protein